ncbi:MAG TPA: hypothetical protein VEY51_01000 [Chondromyces sp.]|nr:hypothetical protein [Chondromyces sp.]
MITVVMSAAAVAGVYVGVSYIRRIGKKGEVTGNPWELIKASSHRE